MNSLSPLSHRFNVMLLKLNSFIFPEKNIFQESFDCYKDRLPTNLKVSWKREVDGFIVGFIDADGDRFMAQGKNAKDFIKMVNDAIYAVYEIPPQYISKLGGYNKYFPTPRELEKLRDKSIKKSSFGFIKQPVPAH